MSTLVAQVPSVDLWGKLFEQTPIVAAILIVGWWLISQMNAKETEFRKDARERDHEWQTFFATQRAESDSVIAESTKALSETNRVLGRALDILRDSQETKR